MDTSTMTFQELLFHGHWHLVGAALFLLFLGVFVHEAVKEALAVRRQGHAAVAHGTRGPLLHDAQLGHMMADGGEPVADAGQTPRKPDETHDHE
ncbi:MAG: hypothetical protein R3D98_02325 [Candidatus Krumholzibacteriia bacterium]